MIPAAVSRRIAAALYGSDMEPSRRARLADATAIADSWDNLPEWVKDAVVRMEEEQLRGPAGQDQLAD